ncbi:hypothetical protein TNCV_4388491 [Trichonephila clavipes]|nr:hypothetical protein TNCV_4388491 [Trichonephila clavipes]
MFIIKSSKKGKKERIDGPLFPGSFPAEEQDRAGFCLSVRELRFGFGPFGVRGALPRGREPHIIHDPNRLDETFSENVTFFELGPTVRELRRIPRVLRIAFSFR